MSSLSTSQNMDNKSGSRSKQCPVGQDLAALGKKWTFHILRSISMERVDRFNQLLRALPGLTPRVLIMRLNELQSCGLIQAVTIQERPRMVRWVMTEKGKDTVPILEGYTAYVAKWHPNASLKNHLANRMSLPTISELLALKAQSNNQMSERLVAISSRTLPNASAKR